MEIRRILPEDIPAYQHIISQSFQRGLQATFTDEILSAADRTRIGVYAGGRLQASLGILDYEMFFGEDRRPCGGIFGVACEPAARGRGYAGALLRRSLEMMRERGQYLSALWPFDFRYYRMYGWDWTGRPRQYVVPIDVMPPSAEAEFVEPVFSDHAALFNPIYEEIATRYNGALARNEKMWVGYVEQQDNRLAASYIYRRDGRAEGCLVIRYTDREAEARATQILAATPRAYRAFLGLMRRHAMTVSKFHWDGPEDDPLWSIVAHWEIETKSYPTGMSRIVDLPAALGALRPHLSVQGEVVLEIADEHAPWNHGTWRVAVDGGHVRVERWDSAAGIFTDIQALTQAYWGTPSLAELRRAGRAEVRDEAQYASLEALLPPRIVWLYDDF